MSERREDHAARAGSLGALVDAAVAAGPTADVGPALCAAGCGLRRSGSLALPSPDETLRRLPEAAVSAWLGAVSLDRASELLLRATLEAVEAGLSDGEDAATWRAWALEALAARDELESAVVGFERWCSVCSPSAKLREDGQHLRVQLHALDGRMSPRARWLVALNADRRAERDLLDEGERADAWWFAARADCDALLPALSGAGTANPHFATCKDCQRDLEAVRDVDSPRLRHLGEEDLWRFDTGAASDGERAVVEAHAGRCSECSQAVQALDEGDAFIAEALGETPKPPRAGPARPDEPMRARRREVMAERPGFKLVLIRENKRTKLLIERASPAAVLRAELVQGGDGGRKAVESPDGLEVELPENAAGPLLVRVFVPGQTTPLTFPVAL